MKFSNIVILVSLAAMNASAAVRPSQTADRPAAGRVCFFTEANYRGQSFCMPVGAQEADLVPSGWNDRVSSILVEGKTELVVYRDVNYRGDRIALNRSVANMAELPGNWNDQVSGFVATRAKR